MLSTYLINSKLFTVLLLTLARSICNGHATEPGEFIQESIKGQGDICQNPCPLRLSSDWTHFDSMTKLASQAQERRVELEFPDRDETGFIDEQKQISIQPSFMDDLGIPPHSVVEHHELLAKFRRIRVLGGGGYARAYEVECSLDQKRYALVIGFREHIDVGGLYVKNINNYLTRIKTNSAKNVHIAELKTMFWLLKKNYPYDFNSIQPDSKRTIIYVFDDLPAGHFINTKYADDLEAQSFYHLGMVMELGLGDLSGEEFQQIVLPSKKFEVELQITMNLANLFRDKIGIPDHKYRNYVYKAAHQVQFHGKRLSEYDFWHYKLNSADLYVPRQDYVIKRIDFDTSGYAEDPTQLREEEIRSYEQGLMNSLASQFHMTTQELLDRFKKPDNPTAMILELF